MTNLSKLTDEQLAECVAVEVLGWQYGGEGMDYGGKYFYPPKCDKLGGWITEDMVIGHTLSPSGRAALEDYCERRYWHVSQINAPSQEPGDLRPPTYTVYICKDSWGNDQISECRHTNKYRAFAEAVLMAKRGEGRCE